MLHDAWSICLGIIIVLKRLIWRDIDLPGEVAYNLVTAFRSNSKLSMRSKLTIAGLLIGSIVGFLFSPRVPSVGQLHSLR